MNKLLKISLISGSLIGAGSLAWWKAQHPLLTAQAQSQNVAQIQSKHELTSERKRSPKEIYEDYVTEGMNKIIIYQLLGLIPLGLNRMNKSFQFPLWGIFGFIGVSFLVDYYFYTHYLNATLPTSSKGPVYLISDLFCYGFSVFTFGGMGLTVTNYAGFLLGTYCYLYSCGNNYNKNISTVAGAIGSTIISAPFWMYWLKNRTNQLLALVWSLVSYTIYGYVFNRQFDYHLNVKEDKQGFSSFMLNTYKWATINLAFFGYSARWTDNVPMIWK